MILFQPAIIAMMGLIARGVNGFQSIAKNVLMDKGADNGKNN